MSDDNSSALQAAIQTGDLSRARELIKEDALVTWSLKKEGSLLCYAIAANQPEVVRFLLSINIDVTGLSNDGQTPLALAICNKSQKCARELIQSGKCNLNLTDRVAFNPPICIAVNDDGQIDIVKWLIEAKCDVNKAGKHGHTALHCAVITRNIEMMKLLLANPGINVNRYDNEGMCPIHRAASCQDPKILETFLENCPKRSSDDPATLDDWSVLDLNKGTQMEGNSALHIALKSSIDECIGLLLEAGCNVNVQNHEGATPLYLASYTARMDYIIPLMAAGGDPNIFCKPTIATLPNTHLIDVSCVHVAILRNNYLLVQRLALRGADLNVQNTMGQTPLHLALAKNRPDIAMYLLKLAKGKEYKIDVNCVDTFQATPLFLVGYCNDFIPAIVNKLVKLGCNIEHEKSGGKRAIHVAMELDNNELVHMLLQNGANPDVVYDGHTPLQQCAFENQGDLTLELITHGADMYLTTPEGETAMRIALENNSTGVIKVLLSCGYNVSREGFSEDVAEAEKLPYYLRDESHVQLRELIFTHAKRPTQLRIQCRANIHHVMRQCGRSLSSVKDLPLPKWLSDFLLMKVM